MRNRFSLFFILFISSYLSFSQDLDKSIDITVCGTGKSLEEARQNALKSSIEQTFGAYISTKTNLLNDQIIFNEFLTISNGNIKSFKIIDESKFSDTIWSCTLKAIISIGKLANFVKSKGYTVEIDGNLFASNIKQQMLNEVAEVKIINNLSNLLIDPLKKSFKFSLSPNFPKPLDALNKNWEMPFEITSTANQNMDFCVLFFKKALSSISMSASEIENYKSLNKKIYTVNFNYRNQLFTFYLRKKNSLISINSLILNFYIFTRAFVINSNISKFYSVDNGKIFEYKFYRRLYDNVKDYESTINIQFPSCGQVTGVFKWKQTMNKDQLDRTTDFIVSPFVSDTNSKYGGYLVYEQNGHGLVLSLFDLGEFNWTDAFNACEDLSLNGFDDWHLPTDDDLRLVSKYLYFKGIGSLSNNYYWSSDKSYFGLVGQPNHSYNINFDIFTVRAVRYF